MGDVGGGRGRVEGFYGGEGVRGGEVWDFRRGEFGGGGGFGRGVILWEGKGGGGGGGGGVERLCWGFGIDLCCSLQSLRHGVSDVHVELYDG